MNALVLRPTAEHDIGGSFSSPQFLLPFGEHEGYSLALESIPEQVAPYTPYPNKDAARTLLLGRSIYHNFIQCGFQHFHIMPLCPVYD